MCCFGIKPWSQKHWVNFKPRPPCIPDRIWKYENWHQAEMFLSFLFLDLSNMFSFLCIFLGDSFPRIWRCFFEDFNQQLGWSNDQLKITPPWRVCAARQRGSGSVGTRSEADGGSETSTPPKIGHYMVIWKRPCWRTCAGSFFKKYGGLIQRAKKKRQVGSFFDDQPKDVIKTNVGSLPNIFQGGFTWWNVSILQRSPKQLDFWECLQKNML